MIASLFFVFFYLGGQIETRMMRSRCVVGTFKTCIKSCKGSAVKLLDLIVNEFKAYRDEAVYEGQRGSFD